jgi:tetratricopeptide (TPR) repeat protein
MWEVLGLAPTTDQRLIRKAYATRLKALDTEADPAGFRALREAYEAALARAVQAPAPPPLALTADGPVPPQIHAPPPEPEAETASGEARVLGEALIAALRAGDAKTAIAVFDRASALGLVPLGQNEGLLHDLVHVAMADSSLPMAALRDLVQRIGWDVHPPRQPPSVALRQQVLAKLDAEAFYASLIADSRSLKPVKESRTARRILGRVEPWRALPLDRARFHRRASEAAHHLPWLADRLNPKRIRTLVHRTAPTPYRERIFRSLCFMMLIVFVIVVQAIDNANHATQPNRLPQERAALDRIAQAQSDLHAGDLDSALTNANQAVSSQPSSRDALTIRAYIHRLRHEFALAAQDLDRADSEGPTLKSIVERGWLLLAGRDPAAARVQVERANKIEPGSIPARLLSAALEVESGNDLGALEAYDALATLQPNNPEIYLARASVLVKQRQFQRAIADYDQAIKLIPNRSLAFRLRSEAHLKNQEIDPAIVDAHTAILASPRDPEARIALGDALFKKGDVDGALLNFKAARELAPGTSRAAAKLSFVFSRQQAWGEALEAIDAALRVEPGSAHYLNDRCWIYAHSGHLDDALADCDTALKIMPDYPEALDSRGFVHLTARRYQAAIEDYNSALSLRPKTATSLYGRGLAEAALGRSVASKADIAGATELDPKVSARFTTSNDSAPSSTRSE